MTSLLLIDATSTRPEMEGSVGVLWLSLIVLLSPCAHASEKPNIGNFDITLLHKGEGLDFIYSRKPDPTNPAYKPFFSTCITNLTRPRYWKRYVLVLACETSYLTLRSGWIMTSRIYLQVTTSTRWLACSTRLVRCHSTCKNHME